MVRITFLICAGLFMLINVGTANLMTVSSQIEMLRQGPTDLEVALLNARGLSQFVLLPIATIMGLWWKFQIVKGVRAPQEEATGVTQEGSSGFQFDIFFLNGFLALAIGGLVTVLLSSAMTFAGADISRSAEAVLLVVVVAVVWTLGRRI